MKIIQQVVREGDDIVVRLRQGDKVIATRTWEGAGKYVRPMATEGYLTVMVPELLGLNIKPGEG